MAITELVFPTSGTPTVPTDYAYQNGYLAQNAKGYNAVSLTNWDGTTTAPEVAEGSAIEINGVTWQVDADTSIATTDASSGVNYLVFDDDAVAFGWNDTAPTWSATLNGWYVSGDRFTGHVCTWDGGSIYLGKEYIKNINGDITTSGPNGLSFHYPIITGSTIARSSDTQEQTATNSYVLIKSLECTCSGVYSVYFRAVSTGTLGLQRARIYIDGVAYGTERTPTTSWVAYSEDLPLGLGASVELWIAAATSGLTQVDDYRLRYGNTTITDMQKDIMLFEN